MRPLLSCSAILFNDKLLVTFHSDTSLPKDIFVWRSFKQDAPTITKNIQDYHNANERRMLFLSPEGVIVDFGEKDKEYINECRKFCVDQGYTPFEYVLTPRYKGSMCLLQQVQKSSSPVVSVCVAYVRDGKLLNCSLLSPDRIVPDIYTLNQGIGGSPVHIYFHLKRMNVAQDMNDPKGFMMENYKEKDTLLEYVICQQSCSLDAISNEKLSTLISPSTLTENGNDRFRLEHSILRPSSRSSKATIMNAWHIN